MKKNTMVASEVIQWAIGEIRGLDELCRSMVPGYEPLDSDDMSKLQFLRELKVLMAKETL